MDLNQIMKLQVKVLEEIRNNQNPNQTVSCDNCDRPERDERGSDVDTPATPSEYDQTETKPREETHDDESSESVITFLSISGCMQFACEYNYIA